MANQCTDQAALSGSVSTPRVMALKHNVHQLLAGVAVALFLFTAIVQAQSPGPCSSASSYCLFISDFHNQTIQLWTDNGATASMPLFRKKRGGRRGGFLSLRKRECDLRGRLHRLLHQCIQSDQWSFPWTNANFLLLLEGHGISECRWVRDKGLRG